MPKYHYATVIDALEKLRKKGYVEDFNLREDDLSANPEKYKIKKVYRYEGDTDPAEEAFVFGIKSVTGEKGVYVMGAAAASEGNATDFIYQVAIRGKYSQEEEE